MITGNSASDSIAFESDDLVTLNGVNHDIDPNAYDRVDIQGLGANDNIFVGSTGNEKGGLYPITVDGGDGNDSLTSGKPWPSPRRAGNDTLDVGRRQRLPESAARAMTPIA